VLTLIGAVSPILVVGGVVVVSRLTDPSRGESTSSHTTSSEHALERRGLTAVDIYNRVANRVFELIKDKKVKTSLGERVLLALTDTLFGAVRYPEGCDVDSLVMAALRAGGYLRLLVDELPREELDTLEKEIRELFRVLVEEMGEKCIIEKKPKPRLPY